MKIGMMNKKAATSEVNDPKLICTWKSRQATNHAGVYENWYGDETSCNLMITHNIYDKNDTLIRGIIFSTVKRV